MVFEGLVWPAMNIFANVFFVFVALQYGLGELLVFWWAQLTILDMAAALYCVAIEEEDLKLALYAVFYRLFFILIIDVTDAIEAVHKAHILHCFSVRRPRKLGAGAKEEGFAPAT